MAEDTGAPPGKTPQEFLGDLEMQGFFRQVQDIETNLKNIAGQLANFARSATERAQETESFAAHILALQAVTAVLARHTSVPAETVAAEIRDEVKIRTARLSGSPEGSAEVHAIVAALLGDKA